MKKILLLLLFVFIASSCIRTKYIEVPVETIRTDYITSVQKDTLIIKDSIDRWLKQDTMFITKYKYVYKTIYSTDTVYKIDTITDIIYKDKIITTNILKDWQKVFIYIGIFSTCFIVFVLYKRFKL